MCVSKPLSLWGFLESWLKTPLPVIAFAFSPDFDACMYVCPKPLCLHFNGNITSLPVRVSGLQLIYKWIYLWCTPAKTSRSPLERQTRKLGSSVCKNTHFHNESSRNSPEAPRSSGGPLGASGRFSANLWDLLERSCLVDCGNGRSYKRQSQIFAFVAPRDFWKPLEGVHPM